MSRKSFVSGAIILMLAGLVVRMFGFVYRIYLSNLIGAEGIGLFGLISPVYSLIILTLTSGISIAVSKMVARELARNHFANLSRITSCALAVVLFCGSVISLVIYLNANFIAAEILKDTRTYYSLLILIPCIPVIAAASALKGYFYGVQDVIPTAASQITEQVVRIGLVMLMAGSFLKLGLEYACALATIGMAIGEISNLAVLYIIYRIKKRRSKTNVIKTGILRKRSILKEMLQISLPVSTNRFVTSIMASAEYILIPRRLLAGGLDYQASIEMYGRLTGMAMPLLFFPALVTTSLAITLVPAISEGMSLNNYKAVNYRISKSVQIALIMGFIFTGVFMCYPHEIGNLLYSRESIGDLLYLLSFTCIFMYLQQTLLGVMNGLGKQGIALRNSIAGSAIRIGFVYFLIPVYGIPSYVLGIALSMGCVCILNLYEVVKTTGMAVDIRNWIIKPGLIGVIMLIIGRYIYSFFDIFVTISSVKTILALLSNVLIAAALMVISGALRIEELTRLAGFKRTRKVKKSLV